MTFNFTVKEFIIGNGTGTPTLQFYKRGFELDGSGSQPSWQDIILSGTTALTLVNAKENGLNYLKLFGGTEQNGTPSPDTPMDIVCNNGVVKAFKTLNISTYDTSASDAGIDITFNGATNRRRWDTLNDNGTGTKHYENGFVSIYMTPNGNTYYVKALVNGVVYNGSVYNTGEQIDSWDYTTVKNIDIYCPTINADGTTETVEINTTGGTATAENLFAIDTYKDIQEILTGNITRKIAIKMLDGTETWSKHSSGAMGIAIPHARNDSLFGYCSHFLGVQSSIAVGNLQLGQFKMTSTSDNMYFKTEYSSTTEWAQWLADQYINGTPVIVIYPLATATIETVVSQSLHIQAGNNTISIVQGSIDNLGLEVSYKAVV